MALFRLLLGREPNREERRGHFLNVGQPIDDLVRSFLTSFEFSRRNLLTAAVNAEVELVKLDGYAIYADRADAAVGRHVVARYYEDDVTAVFKRTLRPGLSVVDIGANIGYFALLAASVVGASGYVLAIEPNGRNTKLLEASRRWNGFDWLTVAQVAAGETTGLLALHSTHSTGNTSAVEDPLAREDIVTVPAMRVDGLVPAGRRVDVIKIDVDGGEWPALQGCEGIIDRDRPVVISEFSPDMMPGISGVSGETYLRWLVEKGYRLGIVLLDGDIRYVDGDIGAVMRAYAEHGKTHIDLLLEPKDAL